MIPVLRRVVGVIVVALCVASATVYAVSVRDIMELSRAGLSDEILLALIESDKTVFSLSTEQLVELKRAGVSDRVIVAMLQQGRKPERPLEAAEPPDAPREFTPPLDYAMPAAPPPPPPSTTVVVVSTPILYPYPVFIPQRPLTRTLNCTPGRIIGRTERVTTPVPGRWVENGRTGGMVFMSDPVCQ